MTPRLYAGLLLVLALVAQTTGERRLLQQLTAAQNYLPVTVTANSAPYDIIATPITPDAPYSQAAYQCNVTGDTRFPAGGTFPLTVRVPAGQRVRIIFANGNLNGATVTQQGEPGVIVQQGGSPIVQQAGSASPIVQPVGSPIVQQPAPPAALVVQQGPTTIVQQPTYQTAQVVQQPPPAQPATTTSQQTTTTTTQTATTTPPSPPPATPTPPSPVPPTTPVPPATSTPPEPATTVTLPAPPVASPAASPAALPAQTSPQPATCTISLKTALPAATTSAAQTSGATTTTTTAALARSTAPTIAASVPSGATGSSGRKLLQETVPGGPNNGQVEYVALASNNTVPGFVVPNTQFGVPYVEFTASSAAAGQTASFRGVLEVAVVIGGVPQYPFRPNPRLSPECQVNVNFTVV